MTRCASAFAACARVPTEPTEIVLARGFVDAFDIRRDFGAGTRVASRGGVSLGGVHITFDVPGVVQMPSVRKKYEIVLREVR